MPRHVRVKKAFNVPGAPPVYEVQARRRWQNDWTILRVYTNKKMADADSALTRDRTFTDEEKGMMKGAH